MALKVGFRGLTNFLSAGILEQTQVLADGGI